MPNRQGSTCVWTLLLFAVAGLSMDKARIEARVDDAVRKFGVSGRGVVVAIMDRGILWESNDFRNPDGSTRIEEIYDLTDNTGANDPNNPYHAGTIYTRAQINAALTGGPTLAHRDAVGHGTTTTGIAAGNGRNSRDWKYRGEAPKATILVVKIVAGAVAHDDQPAEATANTSALFPAAIDYVKAKAAQLGLPLVMLPNIGSITGAPADGTSSLSKKIDSTVGPGIRGLIFVNGSSDDGGVANHAQASIAAGDTLNLDFDKQDSNSLRFDLWYPAADRYEVTIKTPSGVLGPFTPPAANTGFDVRSNVAPGINYYHYGAAATPSGSSSRREVLIDLATAPGQYTVTLRGVTAGGGKLDAFLATSTAKGQFTSNVVPGYTVWDGASSLNNISPNDYVLREKWADIDGVVRGIRQDHVGDLWGGSGIGPTVDGRLGVDFSAPGNTVVATYNPKSVFGSSRSNLAEGGGGLYGNQNAVSGAAPQVTGIVALMLELNPTLDQIQVRQILRQTARADAFTGTVPNAKWGYGKIDALAALTAASTMPGARPYISLDKNDIPIDFPLGSAAPAAAVKVQLTPGPGAGPFVTGSSAAWLSVDKSSGLAPAELMVTANPAGLALGDYDGEITITGTPNVVPQTIMVHLHVRTAGPLITSIEDAGAANPGFANGSFIAIKGFGLSSTTRIWKDSDFQGNKLPTTLDGVSVRVQGQNAFVYFISENQVNVITPDNALNNTRFGITLFRGSQASNQFVANTLPRNPEFFRFDGRYIAAVHLDGTFVGKPGLIPGLTTRAVKANDIVQLYGQGCGETNPVKPTDTIVTGAASVTGTYSVTVGGAPAETLFVGLVASGECLAIVKIPSLPSGDAEVVLQIDSFVSADGAYLTVQ